MKLHTGNVGTRLGGTALGLGFLAIGVFALSISGEAPNAAVGDRAFWMGATFAFAGVVAMAVSWLVGDLSNIWCSPPRRLFGPKPARKPLDGSATAPRISRPN
jgi:hypothetical protein